MKTFTKAFTGLALLLMVPLTGIGQQATNDLLIKAEKARQIEKFQNYAGLASDGPQMGMQTAVMQPNAYCAASGGCDEYISNVLVGTINNSSVCSSGGYHDYTSLSTTMTIGQSYPITVTNGNGYLSDSCGIWIDWNQNEDFTDDAPIAVTGNPGVGPYTATIIPPAGAAPGATRMRIRIVWDETPLPCGFSDYGETEDYTIVIPGGNTADVGMLSTTLPAIAGPGSITPAATVRNFGSAAQTFSVTLKIGTYTSTQTVTSLAAYSNSTVTFAPWTATAGNHTATFYTTLAADTNHTNDTLVHSMSIQALTPVFAYNAYDPSSTFAEGTITFNLQTPTTVQFIAASTSVEFIAAGTWGNNKWYGAEYSGTNAGLLYTIDTATGALTTIGNTGASLTGLAYDPVSAIMYGSNATSLYTVNLSTGATTLVGSFGLTGTMIALAYNVGAGILYGVNLDDNLYTINKMTGAATLVGPLGININYAQDAEFNNNDSVLYLAGYTSTGGLYTINTSTGAATLIGNFPGGMEVTAFAIPYSYASPGVDVGVASIMQPSSGYNLSASETVEVIVNNYGTAPQSNIPVSYRIGTGTPVTETITTSIAPGGSYTHTFTTAANLGTPGSYNITAYTGLSTDLNAANDTSFKTVVHQAPFALPFNETWTSSSFNTQYWTFDLTVGNWIIDAVEGNPAPSASFGWSPNVLAYSHSLVSPMINPGSASNVSLKYDLSLDDYGNTGLEKMDVDVWNGTTWATVATHANTADIPWTTFTQDISSYATGTELMVRFRAYGADSYEIDYWYLDNIIVDMSVGTEELETAAFQVFPNPASDVIHVRATEKILSIRLLNYAGQLVSDQKVDGFETSISSDGLSSGIYFLQVRTADGIRVERVSVQ